MEYSTTLPTHTPVAGPVMLAGVAGRVFNPTVLLLLVPQALEAFTDRLPETNVGAMLTSMLVVP
jgi:hypothetical protein